MPKVKLFDSLDKGIRQIPDGSLKLVLIDDLRICLVNRNNTFYALDDLCPHLGHPLHQGHINAFEELICPLHSYRFHLDTGEECIQRCSDARTYPIEIKSDGVFILV